MLFSISFLTAPTDLGIKAIVRCMAVTLTSRLTMFGGRSLCVGRLRSWRQASFIIVPNSTFWVESIDPRETLNVYNRGGLSTGQSAQTEHTSRPVYLTFVFYGLVGLINVHSGSYSVLNLTKR